MKNISSVRNKMEFDMYKSGFNSLINVENNFGTLSVSECTESIQGLHAKIKNMPCVITKKGLIVDAGIQIDSPARVKEGKAKLNEIWGRELILQHRYPDGRDFTTEVWDRI